MIPIAKNYDAKKDYSEAIAKTTDAAEREQLMEERQNKIDDMGLSGKVADNDTVSKWTENYHPGGWNETTKSFNSTDDDGNWIGGTSSSKSTSNSSTGTSSKSSKGTYYNSSIDISGLYDAIEQARLKAFQDAKEANNTRLSSTLAGIDSNYEQSVRDAQVQSRVSALGNEEKLAALGLNFGGAYEAPTSGYTETSRISQDNNLKTNMNNLGSVRDTAKGSATDAVNTANSQLDSTAASYSAEIKLQKISDLLSQYNADRDYTLKRDELSLDKWKEQLSAQLTQDKLAASTAQSEAELAAEKKKQQSDYELANQKQAAQQAQTAYENALERWKLYGTVLPADAGTLGVASGTKTSAQAYQDAKYKLEQMKTLHQISK